MSAREVIAEVLRSEGWTCEYHEPVSERGECRQCDDSHDRLGDRAVAALREARTMRSVEELDALPVGAIAVEPSGHAWIKHDLALWHCSCDGTGVEWASSSLVEDSHLPLRIVYRPDED